MVSNEKFMSEKQDMQQYVGRECKVVKRNSVDWVTGVIIGIMSDKRSNCNMFRIEYKEGDNKVIMNKKLGAPLFEILDTVSDREIKTRSLNIDNMSKEQIVKELALLDIKRKELEKKLAELK